MNASPLLPLDVASATFLLLTAAMAAPTVLLLMRGALGVAALASAGRALQPRAAGRRSALRVVAASSGCRRTTCPSSSATSTG